MRKASAPILFLVGFLVIAAIGGITLGIGALIGVGDDDDDGGGDVAAGDTTLPPADAELTADQVRVSGVATSVAIVDAQIDELSIPAVTTPQAGGGAGAQFEATTVDGEDAAIVWDAGRPLVFNGSTPLRIDPAPVSLLANQAAIIVAWVDGSVHQVLPGDYSIEAPVAVGDEGVAAPHDRLDFSAHEGTTVSFTGAAASTLPPQSLVINGPGNVIMEGALRVTRPDGTVDDVSRIELPTGSFRISISPRADGAGYDLAEALLEGAVAVA